MTNKLLFIGVVAFAFFGCAINKHCYYEYSTGLPSYIIPDYQKIDKSVFGDYFLNDLYLTLNVTPTYYTASKKRTGAPYRIWFYAVSKDKTYKTMRIDKCKCFSTEKGEYTFDWLPIEYEFDGGTAYENSIFYYSPREKDKHFVDLNIAEKEILRIEIELTLIDTDNKQYNKFMRFVLKPEIRTKYIENLVENW